MIDMIYRRKRFTNNKLEYGIWSFDRRGPKGAPRIFARCSKCAKVNDMTGGAFIAQYNNGKCQTAKSGCASCKFCGRPFSEWVFEKWVPTLTFVGQGEAFFGGKSPSEIAKAVSAFKGRASVYLWANTLAIATFAADSMTLARSGQIDFRGEGWTVSTNSYLRRDFKDFNEGMTALIGYLHGESFVSQTPAKAAV